MIAIPTAADVAATARVTDLPERNRQVTRGNYLYSLRLRERLPGEATWAAFAAWASEQAGRTIRKEDLIRALERRLGDSPEIRRLLEGPFKLAARFAIRTLLQLNPFERSSQAVSRGNIKVYSEIGAVFARYLETVTNGSGAAGIDAFFASLRPGPAPDGQDLLNQAFRLYNSSLSLDGRERSQSIFAANVAIGVHEQTRLQPEIEASVDGSVWDGVELKDRLMNLLTPQLALARWAAFRLMIESGSDPILAPLVEVTRRLIREIVTETMMVIEIGGETLRLGQDLSGEIPASLRGIDSREARDLLALVDTTPDSLASSGTSDWTNFAQRMHFIADLFRSRQQRERIFDSPRPNDLI